MAVSTYNNNNCRYRLDKLDKVVYLISEDDLRNIHIDDGEAFVDGVTAEPLSLQVYNIALTDTDELDERYKFTHQLTFSVDGYANYRDFQGRYFAIVKSLDGVYWLVNPMFPCKVTYTYTLDGSGSHTDFTLSTASNHPTLRVHGLDHSTPYKCGYKLCKFDTLRLNEAKYSLKSGNSIKYTNDGFKDVIFNKNSAVFTEQFDGRNVQHNITFNVKFDDYKSSWHYNLLEFMDNKYSAIIKSTCNKYILTGFHFGLQPSFTVTANDEITMDSIQIQLIDSYDNGNFIGETYDEIHENQETGTTFQFTAELDGYECVGVGVAKYLLKKEVDFFGNATGRYMCLQGYEDRFEFLGSNLIGTFQETQEFPSTACGGDECRLQTSFPSSFVFNTTTCRQYSLMADSDWSIVSSNNGITVAPNHGVAKQSYTVEVCNTIEPASTPISASLTVSYCDKTQSYDVTIEKGNSCFTAGQVFDISANGQYVTVPTNCCVQAVTDSSSTVSNITIQNAYFKLYVPQNNTGAIRVITLTVTLCDMTTAEVIINQGIGFERWIKESTACTGNQKCDVERKYTGTTASDINTRTNETRTTNCVDSSECSGESTRWVDTVETTCSGGKKYVVQAEQVSTDGGQTWTLTGNKRLGAETADSPAECEGTETYEDWRVEGYICEDTTKYQRERLYTSTDSINWIATNTYRKTSVVLETNSEDCGYVHGSDTWKCEKWELDDGYICESTTKYAREQRFVRDCNDCNNCEDEWIATGIYRRTQTVLEQNSEDCGYVIPSTAWTCSEWRVVENDYICEDGTKYTKERKYVRECEDCSDCSVPWIPTDVYRRGSTVIEVNSTDCGYIKGSDEWTCDKWETADGYICEETTKYAREQRYVRECEDCNNCEAEWIATSVYRRTNTVLETNSEDCGYVIPSTAWTCSKWEVVQNDYICEDGTKYTKERRYVRECEDCSDCSAPWIATDVYRRGSTILEVNSTDCGYNPTLSGNCTDYRDDGDTICDGFDKYKYLRKYVRECENCNDCSAAWVATNIYKRGTLIQANSIDCGYIPTDTYERWVEDGYMCDGYSKYKRLRKEISDDNIQWYRTSIFKKGDLIENNSSDCGYIPSITGNCTEYRDEGDTICNGYDKYKYLRKYVRNCSDCSNCNTSWTATSIYKQGTLVQANSIDCGYIPSATYERWEEDGYTCDGYAKYKKLRRLISDDNVQWYETNTYKRGSLIEDRSFDCGYIPTEVYYEWRTVDTMCNGFNKYYRERKYISDDGNRWYETSIYRQGALIESNSIDCGYTPRIEYEYQWVITTQTICIGYSKYYLYKRQRRIKNSGSVWEDVIPTETSYNGNGTMTPQLIEEDSPDCGYTPPIEPQYKWVLLDSSQYICDYCDVAEFRWVTLNTYCNNIDKFAHQKLQYSLDGGATWADVDPEETQEVLVEYNSMDCGAGEYKIVSFGKFNNPMTTYCYGANMYTITENDVLGNEAQKANVTGATIGTCGTAIATNAFYGTSITAITVPSNITDIGNNAFGYSDLANITFESSTPPIIGTLIFSHSNITHINVPSDAVDAYKAVPNLSTYVDKIQASS